MNSDEQTVNNGRTTNRVLFQKNQATGEERNFTVYDQKYVEVTRRSLLGEKSFNLNLSILEPWPVRQRYFSWRWLFGTIYFAVAAIAYGVYIFQHPDGDLMGRLIPFVLIFVLLTLGSLVMFLSRSPHVTEFRSRYCGVPLVSLLYNNPNKQEFSTFVEDLKNRIVAASASTRMDKHQMLINEITRLDKLVKENILTEHIYEQAKKRIPNMKI
ncbi:MAG: sulfite exporter TauE/SafE family protein [Gammaproteobacteria bacterium]|nr:sulfite exporter TauE/SafE family protein [Gammaproteobacteria bacterium]MDH5651125.1 sulfite exporter TauE/SafE family protein [Gammaproteobacteria bacterium]